MHWTQLPLGDQIFTHLDSDNGKETVFAVSRLRAHCSTREHEFLTKCPLDQKWAQMILQHRGIETPRLRRAVRTKHPDPLLYLQMPDKTVLLADGSHTYVALCMRGKRQALAYLVPQTVWRNFTVEGIPPHGSEAELLASHSGIKI